MSACVLMRVYVRLCHQRHLTLCMSGRRRPKAEVRWQAPLASGPLDALVGRHCQDKAVRMTCHHSPQIRVFGADNTPLPR